ncbi:hypothetical protein [Chryseobacterium lactis]|uniref:hypothetical protein n=1 Tax=Chryseobacterium lactis TaxID=1241981 RepID=UPI0016281AA0|nr:hypothetical protein [Chryseobacterium lactis]
MIFIGRTTVYPFHLHTEVLPSGVSGGKHLNISFYQGYAAMFWGKVPSNVIGKKYAVVKDIDTGEILTLDEWPQHVKEYFEKEKLKYRPPFRIRFGWMWILVGIFLFITALFTFLIIYLMIITPKK